MICDKCEAEMILRNGKFGEFYFCPNQYECGKKTVSKNPHNQESTGFFELCLSGTTGSNFYSSSMAEMKTLAHRENIAWCIDELDDDPLY